MNKSERINDMMFYLNKKNQFNLKDITEKYGISKRTALRDIQSLEKLGVPIYSEVGRHGKYKIVNKKLLSSAMFTENEIFSLYFSLSELLVNCSLQVLFPLFFHFQLSVLLHID